MDKLLAKSRHEPSAPDHGDLLNSWKEIALYLDRGIRTVQRWERELGLPVRRPRGTKRSPVVARRSEIDAWLNASPGPVSDDVSPRRVGADPDRGGVLHRFPHLSPQVRANLSRFQHRFRKNMDEFIEAEVETGCTFALVALNAKDAIKRARTLRSAHKAYSTAYGFFVKYGVERPDLRNEIVDRLADLRALIEAGQGSMKGRCAVLEDLDLQSRWQEARGGANRLLPANKRASGVERIP